jgi:ubiquinone/menaquinone biosynthesis C-methylase UbiE
MELPDYKDDAEAYELEENSRPDEMSMIKAASDQVIKYLDQKTNALVLDLCCGTGLPMSMFIEHKNIGKIVGVDISNQYLEWARSRFSTYENIMFVEGDAIESNLPKGMWDIVLLCSAYHHIEDERKQNFLDYVYKLLKPDGKVVIAENILPPYELGNNESYKMAVKKFYEHVLLTAENENPSLSEDVKGLIQRVAQYGYDGDYEYKVSFEIFERHISQSNFTIIYQQKIWPFTDFDNLSSGGNYVLVLTR